MIERIAGPAVTGLLAVGAVTAAKPVTGDFFGIAFEVPTVIAALFGCIVTRVIVGQSDTAPRWMVRIPVDVLSIGVTFLIVISASLSLITALVLGITVAVLGASIIKMAEARGRAVLDALLPGATDDEAAISSAIDKLHRIPDAETLRDPAP